MIRYHVLFYCFCIVFINSGCASTTQQNPTTYDIESSLDEETQIPSLQVKEYIIGIDDILQIQVWRHKDLTSVLKVGHNGTVDIPMVGSIQAANMGLQQFKETVTVELDHYIVNPQVTVTVKAPQSKKIYILGEVLRPGVYVSEEPLSVTEAIAMAGGFSLNAKRSKVLLIRKGQEGILKTRQLDVAATMSGEQKTFTSLRKGDILYVPLSKVASMDRFASHVSAIISPILGVQSFIIGIPPAKDVFTGTFGEYDDTTNIIISP